MRVVLIESTPNKLISTVCNLETLAQIDNNTIGSIVSWTSWRRLQLHEDADLLWTSSEIPHFLFNMALRVHSTSEPTLVVRKILDQQPAQLAWWVGPPTPDSALEEALTEHGLVLAEELTAMALNLNNLTEPIRPPEGFATVLVVDDQQLVDWCRIMTQVSEFPDFAAEAWLDMCRGINILGHAHWGFYLGLLNGEPISTSSLFCSNGVAGIHSVTTLPEFRGAGYGSAMTLAALAGAQKAGFSQAVLYSSPMAVNLYRRLGFSEYGKGRIYLWDKPI